MNFGSVLKERTCIIVIFIRARKLLKRIKIFYPAEMDSQSQGAKLS